MSNPETLAIVELPCAISRVAPLNHDVQKVVLTVPTETSGPLFYAGQYLEILLDNGKANAFSIASSPSATPEIELHIRHNPDSQSSQAIKSLIDNAGELTIRLPKGRCLLSDIDATTPLIFIAGSTGFAPMKSMIETCLAEGSQRAMHLYWGARKPGDIYMPDLPQQWADQHDNICYSAVVSEAEPEDGWQGRRGLVHEAVLEDFDDFSDVLIYSCGSPAMVYAGLDAFMEKGFKQEQMFSDVFEYAPR